MNRFLLFIAFTLFFLTGCDRAPSNIYALTTSDCGTNWTLVKTGEVVPKHTANPCGYNVAIPNWPMAGDTSFKTQFVGNVLSKAKLSYTYNIVDPVLFLKDARYLGKMGANDLEISADTVGTRYEMAENILIDKTLRDRTIEITRNLTVIDANPAVIEDMVLSSMNEVLAKRGLQLADLALVLENDEMTRLAIDAVTAIRVYEASNAGAIGTQVMVARAGATQISVTQAPVTEQASK